MHKTFPKFSVDAETKMKEKCKNFDERALDLLIQMTHLEPSRRISAQAALRHPYFEGYVPMQQGAE